MTHALVEGLEGGFPREFSDAVSEYNSYPCEFKLTLNEEGLWCSEL